MDIFNEMEFVFMLKEQTRYSRLANITKMINTKLDLREVLEQVTIAISEEIVQCDSVGIYLPQEDGTFRGYVGKPEVINGWTLDMHVIDTDIDLLAKEVIETKKPSIYLIHQRIVGQIREQWKGFELNLYSFFLSLLKKNYLV